MKTERKWGSIRIQIKGKRKWTTLAKGGQWWGEGYAQTQDEARAKAFVDMQKLQFINPAREYRTID